MHISCILSPLLTPQHSVTQISSTPKAIFTQTPPILLPTSQSQKKYSISVDKERKETNFKSQVLEGCLVVISLFDGSSLWHFQLQECSFSPSKFRQVQSAHCQSFHLCFPSYPSYCQIECQR